MAKIKTIGILTSGGDAPGMNAAIRAVTRAGIYNGFNIKGIYRGYDGLIKGEVKSFTTENVSGIITRGGTILKTARSKEFMTPEGMQKAYETCQKEEIDALIENSKTAEFTKTFLTLVGTGKLHYTTLILHLDRTIDVGNGLGLDVADCGSIDTFANALYNK